MADDTPEDVLRDIPQENPELTPQLRAATVVAHMQALYPDTASLNDHRAMMMAFKAISLELSGLTLERTGIHNMTPVHLFQIVWFRAPEHLDAFAAVIYTPASGHFEFIDDLAPTWPVWLSIFIRDLTVRYRAMEMDADHPPPTMTLQ